MNKQELRYALTHPQQRVWYTEKLHPGTGMWNNAGTLKIKGKLDYALLERAILRFIEENESIRLRVGMDGNTPYQYIADEMPSQVDILDFSDRGVGKLYEWDSMQTQAPMPMIDCDLYYFALVKLGDSEGGLYAKFHHIISDGLSIVEFSNQVMGNYEKLLGGKELTPISTRSYIQYIEAEQKYLSSKRFEYDKKYWTARFDQLPEPTIIKQKKTNDYSIKAERKVFVLDKAVSSDIRAFCEAASVSPFSLFLAALAIYINRITGKDDIIIGAPVANRTSLNAKGAFGMFVSTVPIRIQIQDDLTFTEFAQVISGDWFSALKHQKYPYDLLIRDLRKKHSALETLYDVTLSYQIGTFEKDVEQFTYEGRWHFSGYQMNSLAIHVNDRESDGKLIVDYDHHSPFFSNKEIEYFHAHLINIVRDIIFNPDKKLYMLELLAEEERERILHRFNATERNYPKGETLADMWRKRIAHTPKEQTAIINQGKSMTYGELEMRSTALALCLKEQGVGANDIVGLLVERTMEYFVCVLAILKAGGAFLPIDSMLPNERIAYMLSDSGAKLLLCAPNLKDKCPKDQQLRIIDTTMPLALSEDASITPSCGPNELAYVIYTSGSTGQPKGVQIEHHSIVHFVYSLNEIWDLSPGARLLCASSISFDISVMELVLSLMNGVVVVLAQEHEVNIPRNMVNLIKSAEVNMLVVTPGRMELLLSDTQGPACLKNFREIGMGGDVLPEKLLARVQQCTGARITNFYGPTEITVCATCTDVTRAKIPNIGSPMPNVKAYILDTHMNPVPIGVPGELYIGGEGVARGYINKPELNEERFIDNPFNPGEKLYRTGDLTRWYPLGEIEFLGRIDKQVKIRGYRIELGEIENRLMQIPGVSGCVVAPCSDSQDRKFLAAYLCGNPPKVPDIKAQLTRDLPAYMIPSYFVMMEELPFNASGKVDRNRLPDPIEGQEAVREDYAPPQTPTEKALAEIWQGVLGIDQIDRNDSFFDIGGDSLSIVTVMAQIPQAFHVEIMLEDVYRLPQLKDFAALIDAAEKSAYKPIVTAPEQDDYPVSSAQQRMWVLEQGETKTTAYNVPMAFVLSEKPDMDRLQAAFDQLIHRHDALRTTFVLRDGELRQVIAESVKLEVSEHQCQKDDLKDMLLSLVRPFDLDKAPLMRAALIETEDESIMFMDTHHIISDRRSAEIVMQDLADLYMGISPEAKKYEYKDFAVWQQSYLKSETITLQREYWQNVFADELPLLNLHTDRPRAAVQQFEGAHYGFDISKKTADRLREFTQEHGGTLFMAVLAVYNVLLAKYTGQEDIIVGTPVSGRSRKEVQDIVGVFINTLPLRNHPHSESTFEEFFMTLCDSSVAALAHSDYPLERIIADLPIQRDASRNPLFDTMLVQAKAPKGLTLGNVTCTHYPFAPEIAKLDLTLEVYEGEDGLACQFEYNTQLWNESTIRRMSRHLERLFDLLVDEPDTRIKDVPMLTLDEIWQVTQGFNQTDTPFTNISIQSLLEDLAVSQGDKTALVCDGKRMTFAELNNRANQIALKLREMGVGRNTIVALCLPRSLDLMVGLFGVLKAGGGYLPMDPDYPSDRIAFMLEDSGATILLTKEYTDVDFDGEVLNISSIPDSGTVSNLPRVDCMEDAAYVIYTSGSTGTPKGATLPRRGLLNLYKDTKKTIAYHKDDLSVSVTTVAFDIFIGDAVLPLLFGCTVALCTEEELRQPHLLAKLIESVEAKFIQTTPTRMRIMMDDALFRNAASRHIKKIVLGGEMIPMSLLDQIRQEIGAQVINGYGPTEATVYSSFKDVTDVSRVTIGRPVANTRMYILDQYKRPVPVGVLGELYISGAGVGSGYINRDELTRERFVPDPYWPGHIMYQTGDVCTFREDGDVEICGRVDHQVKIRGLRIELGEVEAAMRAVDGIDEAVVKDWGEGVNKYLCAYYAQSKLIDQDALRQTLGEQLPVYMVPSYFVAMDGLPTTLNGKVNRKMLLEPDRQAVRHITANVGNLSDDESKMGKVWSEVLGVEGIGPDDDFFVLGGDSLGVIKVQAAVLQYGWEIRTKDFYENKTLRAVCGCINAQQQSVQTGPKDKLDVPIPEYMHLKPARMRKVLLTGATGYLGAHLLETLTEQKDTHVYCIVRGKDRRKASNHLQQRLLYYFGVKKCTQIRECVTVLCGDVSAERFGLDAKTYMMVMGVDTVIHSAAITDHMGQEEMFQKVNVDGTRHVTALAEMANAALIHISTASVSGTKYVDNEERTGVFSENNYYVGQNYADNVYIKSKFEAEEIVLDAIAEGLNARIMRVGMLTATKDGRFQRYGERNAFANRIAAICAIGCVPMGMMNARIEMTPVDICAQVILRLVSVYTRMPVYHVLNTNTMTLKQTVAMLEENGYPIEVVSDKAFILKMTELSRQGNFTHLQNLIHDIGADSENPKMEITADRTVQILEDIGFKWPIIDSKYVGNFLRCIVRESEEGDKEA